LRLHESGKRHEMPPHHNHKLEIFLDDDIAAAGISDDG